MSSIFLNFSFSGVCVSLHFYDDDGGVGDDGGGGDGDGVDNVDNVSGVCVKPLHFHYNKTLELLQFIELNRILGVTK